MVSLWGLLSALMSLVMWHINNDDDDDDDDDNDDGDDVFVEMFMSASLV